MQLVVAKDKNYKRGIFEIRLHCSRRIPAVRVRIVPCILWLCLFH